MIPKARSQQYEDARLKWRKDLPDVLVRELASEYLRGMVDECTTDAFHEYESRWGVHTVQKGKNKGEKRLKRKVVPKKDGKRNRGKRAWPI